VLEGELIKLDNPKFILPSVEDLTLFTEFNK